MGSWARGRLIYTSPSFRWPTSLRIEHEQGDIAAHLCAVNGHDLCQSGEYKPYSVGDLAHSLTWYKSLYPFGFTGYVDPLFGCTVIDPVSLDLSRKYVVS